MSIEMGGPSMEDLEPIAELAKEAEQALDKMIERLNNLPKEERTAEIAVMKRELEQAGHNTTQYDDSLTVREFIRKQRDEMIQSS